MDLGELIQKYFVEKIKAKIWYSAYQYISKLIQYKNHPIYFEINPI